MRRALQGSFPSKTLRPSASQYVTILPSASLSLCRNTPSLFFDKHMRKHMPHGHVGSSHGAAFLLCLRLEVRHTSTNPWTAEQERISVVSVESFDRHISKDHCWACTMQIQSSMFLSFGTNPGQRTMVWKVLFSGFDLGTQIESRFVPGERLFVCQALLEKRQESDRYVVNVGERPCFDRER